MSYAKQFRLGNWVQDSKRQYREIGISDLQYLMDQANYPYVEAYPIDFTYELLERLYFNENLGAYYSHFIPEFFIKHVDGSWSFYPVHAINDEGTVTGMGFGDILFVHEFQNAMAIMAGDIDITIEDLTG